MKTDAISKFEENINGEKIELFKSRVEKTHESCGKSYMVRIIVRD